MTRWGLHLKCRLLTVDGLYPFRVTRRSLKWLEARHGDPDRRREGGPKQVLAWDLGGRRFREAQTSAVTGFADSMQLDGLRAAAVAGRAITAGNPPGAAAIGAGSIFGAAHKPDALAAGTVPDRHT